MQSENERLKLNLAIYDKNDKHFEINVDPDMAMKVKKGQDVEMRQVLKATQIFKDTQKGLTASEDEIEDTLGTDDIYEASRKIIEEGRVQLTQEYREKLRDKKRKKVINMIHKNGIDPRRSTPHPKERIKSAMEEKNIKIDHSKDAKEQIQDIVDDLRPILPIKFAKKIINITIPADQAGKSYNTIHNSNAKIVEEEWNDDGSWNGQVEIPGGLENDFYDKINNATNGKVKTKVLEEKKI